jgi:hypothetical protein
MMRKWIMVGAGLLSIVLVTGTSAGRLWAAQAAAPAQEAPKYTLPEYNAYKAADAEQNPQQKIKALDAFVMQYPNSSLLPFVYPDYYNTYMALKNYAQAIVYADKQIAFGDKIDAPGRLDAYYKRALAYYSGSSADKSLAAPDAAMKARDAAAQGLATLDMVKKPDGVADDAFAQTKKQYATVFDTIAAMTSTTLKDYPAAVTAYKALLMLDPNDAVSHFRLGVVYLSMMPAQSVDGFWEVARSIGLKSPNGPNAAQVTTYLRGQIVRYQQAACDKLVDDEITSLITMAGSSNDRPATLNIPSAADLQKARDDTANFLPALKAGGDAGQVMWLATCGLEYPDVAVRVMENPTPDGDALTFKAYRPLAQDPKAAEDELNAATDPNMTIKVVGQPEASRISKDGPTVRFTGTLVGYTQNPFMLTWDKAKINAEDIPEEKGPAKKAPAKKAPAKKAGA